MFVFMSVVVTVWGSVGMFVVYRPLLKIVGFEPWSVEVYCVFCVRDVMDVVRSVCIVWSCRCSCMRSMRFRHAHVVCLCASRGSSQCCVLHDLQFVNAGRGCKRRPYGRGILQSRSHNCLVGSHECLLLFTPSCCSECFYDL